VATGTGRLMYINLSILLTTWSVDPISLLKNQA